MPINSDIPSTITVGDRTYELLEFLEKDETSVLGQTLFEFAQKMGANTGKDDDLYLLDHQAQIPESLRDKVVYLFIYWDYSAGPADVTQVSWFGGRWVKFRSSIYDYHFGSRCRVLRRKPVGRSEA